MFFVLRWLNNQVQRLGLGYVLVPEYHKKDKRIHAHALISGDLRVEHNDIWKVDGFRKPIRGETIRRYKIPPERVRYPVYNCPDWRYGFSTAIRVYGTPARLANYVLKYITKQTDQIFGKSYWCSKNLHLYPVTELRTLGPDEYAETCAPGFYVPGAGAAFKYINNLGEEIADMAEADPEEAEVLDL